MTNIMDFSTDSAKKLGILGFINYIGGLILYIVVAVDINMPDSRRIIFASLGTVLLIFSGSLYYLVIKLNTSVAHGGLNAITQIYNRVAEQLSMADEKKAKVIMEGLKEAPNSILKVIGGQPKS